MTHQSVTICLLLIVLELIFPASAHATQPKPYGANTYLKVQLEPQPLTNALIVLGQMTQINILFSASNTSGIVSKKISGKLPIQDIFKRLLSDTSLQFHFVNDNTVVIDQAPHIQEKYRQHQQDLGNTVHSVAQKHDNAPSLKLNQDVLTGTQKNVSNKVIQGFDGIEKIIVTGSRLKRGGRNTNVPVTLIDQSYINLSSGSGLADTLLGLSALSPSTFSGVNSQAQTSGGAGLNFLNLRGLGFNRTLVLVNGRRHVGSRRGTSAVNINTIPEALIQRVEVSTGGASAVYGADAISGTVNIVLLDSYEGTKVDMAGAFSTRKDAGQGKISITSGQSYDKSSWVVSAIYEETSGVEAVDRSYASNGLHTIANPANRTLNDEIPNFIHSENVRFNAFSLSGSFDVNGERYLFTDDGQNIRAYDFGLTGNRSGRQIGGDGVQFEVYDSLRLPLKRSILSSLYRYDINETSELFFEGKYAKTQGTQFFQPIEDPINDGLLPIHSDNPFIPTDLTRLLQGNPSSSLDDLDTIYVSKVHTEFGRRGSINKRDTIQVVAGIQGDINPNWQYEVFTTYGQTKENILSINNRVTERFFQSIDAVADPVSGQTVCRALVAREQGCEPLNIIGIGNTSDAAINYSRINLNASEILRQVTAGASVSGEVNAFSHSPLDIALGIEYRKESSARRSSDLQATGQTFLPQIPSNSGSYHVLEAYAEGRIPLLQNKPFIDELSTEIAIRISDYNTSGVETAWHNILNYVPSSHIRIRGTTSKAVRAPNINELFALKDNGFVFLNDLCDAALQDANANRSQNCQSQGLDSNFDARNSVSKSVAFSGNRALIPETAKTNTLGIVLTPEFIPDFSLTTDFWKIDLTNAINSPNPQRILENCIDAELPVTQNPFCQLIERDSQTGLISSVLSQSSNIGRVIGSGIDFDVNYSFPLVLNATQQEGQVSLRVFGTYLDKLTSFLDASNSNNFSDLAGVGSNPRMQFNTKLSYGNDYFLVGWRSRYIGSSAITLLQNLPEDQFDLPYTGNKMFHDIFFQYDANSNLTLRLNINNIFDNKPPRRGFNIKQGRGSGGLYPNLGSSISFGLNYHFN